MTDQRITDGFIDDIASIRSEALRGRIRSIMHSVTAFPELGSTQVPRSAIQRYGVGVRKIAVKPFDLVYRYDEAGDMVVFEALVHTKMRR